MSNIISIPSAEETLTQDCSTSSPAPTPTMNIMSKRTKRESINSSIQGMLITCSDKHRKLSMKLHEFNPITSPKSFSHESFENNDNDCDSNASIIGIYDKFSSYSFMDNSVNISPAAIGNNVNKYLHTETQNNSEDSKLKPHGRFSIFKRAFNRKYSSVPENRSHVHAYNGTNIDWFKFENEDLTPQIFSVTLEQSVQCSSQSITSQIITYDTKSHIYDDIPTVIVKCIDFIIPDGLGISGIFRLNGSTSRIKRLQNLFELGPLFGQDLKLSEHGFTIHDVSNILKRYLNSLEESVIPLEFYNESIELMMRFTNIIEEMKKDNFRFHSMAGVAPGPSANNENGSNKSRFNIESKELSSCFAILISKLPNANQNLLLCLLEVLFLFQEKNEINFMNSYNLSAIFEPGIFTHPSNHNQKFEESNYSRLLLQFMINNSKSIISESLIIIHNYDQSLLKFKNNDSESVLTRESINSEVTLDPKVHFEEAQGKSYISRCRAIRIFNKKIDKKGNNCSKERRRSY